MNYNGRIFEPVSNSANGQVSGQTRFFYHQVGRVLWGTYKGGEIIAGTLTGLVHEDGTLEFHYQHIDTQHELRLGKCRSVPEQGSNGELRLREKWQWLNGDQSQGESLLQEVLPID
ncbi:n-acetylglutamate synthase [Phaeodactylibacter luteus]|uniref:N-acetylglutamate synthase n=1 Tax=Phaeodactylibacter luteus TaxID=1564516 RepID=A0A5C6S527_9BACT|nr:n-acetylglutamate synthase [Phaeodactylibacter luteus]TXB69523.1 n-acetylglutamate synthase [Phaeodactylibacter luteus]